MYIVYVLAIETSNPKWYDLRLRVNPTMTEVEDKVLDF